MQAAEEIASEIERQIRDTSTKIDNFIASQSQELSRVQQDHEHTMRDLEAKIQRLKHEHGSVGDRYQSLQGQLAMERVRLDERQAEVGRLEASASSLPAEVETSKAKEEAAQRQHAGAKQELEKTEVQVRHQLAEFARGLDAYKRLGLAFENVAGEAGTSNNIRVVFTLIHPTDPTRRYCFDVHVSPTDDSYAVTSCLPPVAALEGLVAQLNATNQFAVFVQQMRKEFVALARG